MNELFAADPVQCQTDGDVAALLRLFGTYSGRYLAVFPIDWIQQIQALARNLPDLEGQRVMTRLRRAREQLVFHSIRASWKPSEDWLENALRHGATSRDFREVIVEHTGRVIPSTLKAYRLSEVHEIPLTAEERIGTLPGDFVRAATNLIRGSTELHLVDPYMSPLKSSVAPVLEALFSDAAKGKTEAITLWARGSEVARRETDRDAVTKELERQIRSLAQAAGFLTQAGRSVRLMLVEDETSENKLHERLLLSLKGAIRFDQGFQRLPQSRKSTCSPVGRSLHEQLVEMFVEGRHGLTIRPAIVVEASRHGYQQRK